MQAASEHERPRRKIRTLIDREAVKELQKQWAQKTLTPRPTYHYACADCGTEFDRTRRLSSQFQPRCRPCAYEKRTATKRATWHERKEQYKPRRKAHIAAKQQEARENKAKGKKNLAASQRRAMKATPDAPGTHLASDVRHAMPVESGSYRRPTGSGPVVVWTPDD